MRMMTMMTCAAVLVAGAGMARLARATEVSTAGNSPTQVEGRCGQAGGVFFPRNKQGVYACLNTDGSGIICGGVGDYANTCEKFGPNVVKDRSKVPVRADVIASEKAQMLKQGK